MKIHENSYNVQSTLNTYVLPHVFSHFQPSQRPVFTYIAFGVQIVGVILQVYEKCLHFEGFAAYVTRMLLHISLDLATLKNILIVSKSVKTMICTYMLSRMNS